MEHESVLGGYVSVQVLDCSVTGVLGEFRVVVYQENPEEMCHYVN